MPFARLHVLAEKMYGVGMVWHVRCFYSNASVHRELAISFGGIHMLATLAATMTSMPVLGEVLYWGGGGLGLILIIVVIVLLVRR